MNAPYERMVGRYALFGPIATGGMATVYLGRFTSVGGFGRTVAIKSLHPQYARDPDFLSMFIDEARLASRIQHPNVVSTLDIVTGDGELFLVMEYIAGETLSRLLKTSHRSAERLPVDVALSIIVGILHGLHVAHEAQNEQGQPLGLVHRDISPQNILVGGDGVARIVDFGIATAFGRVQITRDGQLKGKLAYMSPEQLRQERLDRRADIYAASIVLWEMLTGRRLFQGDDETTTLKNVLMPNVTAPSKVVPDLPAVLDAIVLKGLAERREDRYATAQEMAAELEAVARLATAREVGRWVLQLAGPELRERATRVTAIERVMAAQPQTAPESVDPEIERLSRSSVDSEARTEILSTGFANSEEPTRGAERHAAGGWRGRQWLAAGGALILALIGGMVLWIGRSRQPIDNELAGTRQRVAAEETRTGSAVSSTPLSELPVSQHPSQTPPAVLTAPAPSGTFAPRAREARRVVRSTSRGGDDCADPFTIDASGVKIPKRHCLKKE